MSFDALEEGMQCVKELDRDGVCVECHGDLPFANAAPKRRKRDARWEPGFMLFTAFRARGAVLARKRGS